MNAAGSFLVIGNLIGSEFMKRGPYKKKYRAPLAKRKVIFIRVSDEQHAEIVKWSAGRKIQTACLHQILRTVMGEAEFEESMRKPKPEKKPRDWQK
jgi:hypothetical protein